MCFLKSVRQCLTLKRNHLQLHQAMRRGAALQMPRKRRRHYYLLRLRHRLKALFSCLDLLSKHHRRRTELSKQTLAKCNRPLPKAALRPFRPRIQRPHRTSAPNPLPPTILLLCQFLSSSLWPVRLTSRNPSHLRQLRNTCRFTFRLPLPAADAAADRRVVVPEAEEGAAAARSQPVLSFRTLLHCLAIVLRLSVSLQRRRIRK